MLAIKNFFLITIAIGLLAICAAGVFYIRNVSRVQAMIGSNNLANKKGVELIKTQEEEEESSWSKWTNKETNKADFLELVKAGHSGNRGALYLTGLCFLFGGSGLCVNSEKADDCFALAASLGFAPAFEKIARKYIFERSNPFLAAVYINLCIAHGHKEFFEWYAKFCDELTAQKGGMSMIREIEKMAEQKMDLILKNQDKLQKTTNQADVVSLLDNITNDDCDFTNDYWEVLLSTHMYLEKMGLKSIEQLDAFQKALAAEAIKTLIDSKEATKNEISDSDIRIYVTTHLQNCLETKEGREQIIEEMIKLNKISIIREDTMNKIIEENNGTPPLDIIKKIEDRSCVQIGKIINEFKAICYA